jgi:hypothetical protein
VLLFVAHSSFSAATLMVSAGFVKALSVSPSGGGTVNAMNVVLSFLTCAKAQGSGRGARRGGVRVRQRTELSRETASRRTDMSAAEPSGSGPDSLVEINHRRAAPHALDPEILDARDVVVEIPFRDDHLRLDVGSVPCYSRWLGRTIRHP